MTEEQLELLLKAQQSLEASKLLVTNNYIERNQVPHELVHPAVNNRRKEDHPLAKFAGILSDAEAAEIKKSIEMELF